MVEELQHVYSCHWRQSGNLWSSKKMNTSSQSTSGGWDGCHRRTRLKDVARRWFSDSQCSRGTSGILWANPDSGQARRVSAKPWQSPPLVSQAIPGATPKGLRAAPDLRRGDDRIYMTWSDSFLTAVRRLCVQPNIVMATVLLISMDLTPID